MSGLKVKFICRKCGKYFGKAEDADRHIGAKHGGKGGYRIQKKRPVEQDDESMASRAIQAEIDIACGFGSDDDWLLP